jgi:hypothetical protein
MVQSLIEMILSKIKQKVYPWAKAINLALLLWAIRIAKHRKKNWCKRKVVSLAKYRKALKMERRIATDIIKIKEIYDELR